MSSVLSVSKSFNKQLESSNQKSPKNYRISRCSLCMKAWGIVGQ